MTDVLAGLMLVTGGLFAGGGATFAWSRVPIWRGLSLREFAGDFEATIRWTDKVQPALLVVAAAAAVAFAVSAEGAAATLGAAGAATLLAVLGASLAILVPLQRRIIALARATNPPPAELEAMRARWFSGNLGRSLLSVAAYALLVAAALA